MINYDEILVVAYRTNIEGLFQLHGEEPTILQVRLPVAQTPVIAAVVALRDLIIVGHFLCSKFKDYKSTATNRNSTHRSLLFITG
jgi:hypothetical protein